MWGVWLQAAVPLRQARRLALGVASAGRPEREAWWRKHAEATWGLDRALLRGARGPGGGPGGGRGRAAAGRAGGRGGRRGRGRGDPGPFPGGGRDGRNGKAAAPAPEPVDLSQAVQGRLF